MVGTQNAYKYVEKGNTGINDGVLIAVMIDNSTLLIRLYSKQETQNSINEDVKLFMVGC